MVITAIDTELAAKIMDEEYIYEFAIDVEHNRVTSIARGKHGNKRNKVMNLDTFGKFCKDYSESKGYTIFSRGRVDRTGRALALVSAGEEDKNCTFRINAVQRYELKHEIECIIAATIWVDTPTEEE